MTALFFARYRQEFEARPPSTRDGDYPDAMDDLTGRSDCLTLTPAPFAEATRGRPPRAGDQGADKYLWLVRQEDVKVALEEGETGRATLRGRLAHTNFTGGAEAWCGGELWFKDEASVWLNGGSGRYPPCTREELDAVVEALCAAGYAVCCAGWDGDKPARQFPGVDEEEWRSPTPRLEDS